MTDHTEREIELVEAHARGEITTRQIVSLLDVSTEEAFDLLEEVYEERGDLGGDGVTTYRPRDFGDDDVIADVIEDLEGNE